MRADKPLLGTEARPGTPSRASRRLPPQAGRQRRRCDEGQLGAPPAEASAPQRARPHPSRPVLGLPPAPQARRGRTPRLGPRPATGAGQQAACERSLQPGARRPRGPALTHPPAERKSPAPSLRCPSAQLY